MDATRGVTEYSQVIQGGAPHVNKNKNPSGSMLPNKEVLNSYLSESSNVGSLNSLILHNTFQL